MALPAGGVEPLSQVENVLSTKKKGKRYRLIATAARPTRAFFGEPFARKYLLHGGVTGRCENGRLKIIEQAIGENGRETAITKWLVYRHIAEFCIDSPHVDARFGRNTLAIRALRTFDGCSRDQPALTIAHRKLCGVPEIGFERELV